MRYFLALILLGVSSFASADEVRCYNGGKLIYHHQAGDFRYLDGLMAFTEAGTNKIVFASVDCIVKIEV